MPSERVVIWIPTGDHGWDIEPTRPHEPPWLAGGLRTMHELAVAIAATGRSVEMRGVVHPPALDELCAAARARLELPERARPLTAADTVIVPEGIDDPAIHARLSMSPARVILLMLGPPGLIGWSFTPGWTRADPLAVDPADVARPEHFTGAAALGHELWATSPGIQAAADAAGVPCRLIGHGMPGGFPAPPPRKDIDVVALRDNRWAPLTGPVIQELTDLGVDCLQLPQTGHDQVLATLGRARILLHPLRVEGHSRIGCEARAMGAVPVVLDSNPFGVGLDESGGSLSVSVPSEMAAAATSLLADRERLGRLSATAMSSARRQVEWGPYLARVEGALDRPADDRGRGARGTLGAALRERDAIAGPGRTRADRPFPEPPERSADGRTQQLERSLSMLNEALAAEREELERHKLWLEAMNTSVSWRLTAPLRGARAGALAAAASRALQRRRRAVDAVTDAPAFPPGFFDLPRGRVDAPVDGDVIRRGVLRVRGWCLFPGSGVARVDVAVDAAPATQARIGIERPDVAELTEHPRAPVCGFELVVDLTHLPARTETIAIRTVAYALDGSHLRLNSVTLCLDSARPPTGDPGGRGARLRAHSHSTTASRDEARPNDRLRVLVFSHDLARGGASLYLSEVLRRLATRGKFQFVLVTLDDGPLRPELEAAGIAVHVTNGPALASIEDYEGHLAELYAWAEPQGFDIALVNTLGAFPGADLAARLDIPFVWSIHESLELGQFWAAAYPPGTPHRYVEERAEESMKQAAALVFTARATARLFAPYAEPERLLTLPYGIELPEIDVARRLHQPQATRRRLGIPADAKVILSLGTIEPRKSQTMLVEAFAEIAERHPSALLLLVGKTGPGWAESYIAGLEEWLTRSDLAERVRVEPLSEDPYPFHAVADLYVCASDVESLPRSIVEAMAFETPVLSTDIFGVPDLIEDGRAGFLCPPRDTAALAEALDRALSAPPEMMRSIALAGSRVIRDRHDPARHASRFAELLSSLATDPGDASPRDLLRWAREEAELTTAQG